MYKWMSAACSILIAHRLLGLLLLVTAVKGVFWAAAFPPIQPADEIHHIGYARDIAAQGTLAVTARDVFTPEEVIVLDIARVVEVSGFRRPLDLSPARVEAIAHSKKQLRTAAEWPVEAPSPWVHYFSRYHPPFYYALGALIQWLARPPDLLAHLALARLLSVGATMATVLFTYLLARELFPGRPLLWLTAAAITSFLPMVTYLGAVYTNQALEVTLFTVLFYLGARVIRRGLSLVLAVNLGLLLGVGLLTKISFLIALPLLGIVAVYELYHFRRRPLAWLLVPLIAALIAGSWYWTYFQLGNGGLADRREEAVVCGPFLSYLFSLPLRRLVYQYWVESVAAFGHRDSLLSPSLYQAILSSMTLALIGWGRQAWWTLKNRHNAAAEQMLTREQWFMGLLFVLAWIGVYAFYFLVGYLISCDRRSEYTQGRQATSMAAGIALFLVIGWTSAAPRFRRGVFMLLLLLIIGLNSYALGHVIARYYGSQQWTAVEERELLSAPLTADHPVSQCFQIEHAILNRADIWLEREAAGLRGNFTLTVRDAAGSAAFVSQATSLGWGLAYPAYFRFEPTQVNGPFCLEFRGDFDSAVQAWAVSDGGAVWNDGLSERPGALSLLLYRPVSWSSWPERMAVQSADWYTPAFYRWLGWGYLFTLLLFLTGCVSATRRSAATRAIGGRVVETYRSSPR
jgi:hypothetical protein